jgi:hypothetical protein
LVRNRFKDEETLYGIFKPVPSFNVDGLKGRGGPHTKSLFEEIAVIEEVYKIHK